MTKRSLPATWRNTLRDSRKIDKTAKLVGFVLSTYLNGQGEAFPSQDTIAAGASLTDRAVYSATRRLEAAGFLIVSWSRGRRSHTYIATVPATANPVRGSTANGVPGSSDSTANGVPPTANGVPPNPERGSPESSKKANESGGRPEKGDRWGELFTEVER